MSTIRRCQECGRRLADVLFCPRCGEWFCCTTCLAADKARHLRSNPDQVVPLKVADPNLALPTARILPAKLNSKG